MITPASRLVHKICDATNDARAQQIEAELLMLNRRLSNLTLPLEDFLDLRAWREELCAELAKRRKVVEQAA